MAEGRGAMTLSVLGPTRLRRGGTPIELRPRERGVLAALALRRGRPVTSSELVDLVWGEFQPKSDRKALQNQLVRVRRAAGPTVVETRASGYVLGDDVDLDVTHFERLVGEARTRRWRPERRIATLRDALASWAGTPYADLGTVAAGGVRAQLVEQRLVAEEELGAALLEVGDPDVVSILQRLSAEEPYRERRWWLLVVALHRSGQRRQARQQLAAMRQTLADLGLVPSEELVQLDALVAVDDPALRTLSPPPVTGSPRPVRPVGDKRAVGRTQERRRLAEVLGFAGRRPSDARQRGVIVFGEEGIGKTTLLRAVADDAVAAGTRVLWGSCDANAAVPLAPFVQILETLAATDPRQLAASAGPGARVLGALSPSLHATLRQGAVGSDGGQRYLFDTVERVLTAAGRTTQVLVVIDDLHLAPPTTRLLVTHLLGAEGSPPMLVATRTQAGTLEAEALRAGSPGLDVVTLGSLNQGAVGEQLQAILAGPVEAGASAWIHHQAGGNPLFVGELARELAESGALRSEAGHWVLDPPAEAPPGLRRPLLRWLAELSDDVRATLQAAAVLGFRFSTDVLAAMVGDADRALVEAVRTSVLEVTSPGHLAFRHEVLYRAVIDAMSDGARLEMHEAAAGALEVVGNAPPGELARHHLATTSLDPGRAVASAQVAGDAALATFAYAEAAGWYRDASEVARHWLGARPQACELAIRFGGALRQAGDRANTKVLLAAAAEARELADGDLQARAALALCQLGPTTEAGVVHTDAIAVAENALETAGDPVLLAEVAGAASLAYSLNGDHHRCRSLFERAEHSARELGDDQLLARVLPYAYMALSDPDDLPRRQLIAEEVVALGTRSGDLTTEWEGHHLRFSVLLQQGDPALGESFHRLSELAALVREPSRDWETHYLAAAVAHLHGELDEAERIADASLEHAGTVAESRVVAAWAIQILAVRGAQGRLAELVPSLERLVTSQPGVPAWRAALAWSYGQAGDLDRAAAEIDATACGATLPRDSTWTGAMWALARTVHALGPGAQTRARVLHGALFPYAGRMSWVGTCSLGPMDTALAALAQTFGDEVLAARHAAAAAHRAAHLGAPVFLSEVRALHP